ncbi:ankyrin repeat and SOCS box protein 6 isoform X3 [Enhydra lutris kenyoni]|uniref:Ankyrin repeat and SOCS box protein 6 isoform X3 n=1 Tax=Enhydra lutris kenyoni TaxID=391180 RepID=A0A2Y9J6X5_ENHLU|nr:ankyrin repeat and SOCS box protein 6 isoform X3 [Enhydra lutris kenyoni]XP_032721952.1 ankyrin repeat and SOCS box protein 6 isoform X2 [Lontra canadensis]
MPFLHGFRRIIFEYQPLVDAILGSLGIQDPERQEPLDGPGYVASEESRILVLTELLERKAHSPFYQEGVSSALLRMAELGLTRAAAVLLRSGASLNFEDPVTYYTALHIAVLRNQPDMVELLVRHGADINRRDRERPLCSTPWPAATACRSTTLRTSGSCWKEGQMSRPPPKMGTRCSPASSSCLGRPWEGTKRRPR